MNSSNLLVKNQFRKVRHLPGIFFPYLVQLLQNVLNSDETVKAFLAKVVTLLTSYLKTNNGYVNTRTNKPTEKLTNWQTNAKSMKDEEGGKQLYSNFSRNEEEIDYVLSLLLSPGESANFDVNIGGLLPTLLLGYLKDHVALVSSKAARRWCMVLRAVKNADNEVLGRFIGEVSEVNHPFFTLRVSAVSRSRFILRWLSPSPAVIDVFIVDQLGIGSTGRLPSTR